ncbi:ribosome biogenesis protein Nop16 [Protomyces lactucae-debilis]|uniref:Nucleolar protein 16 n=1 Tax=Protomyces lactucae-debilis TaxID=2754530 RepID=A0A1Y2EZ33_PROLT|nr:ribosome biogenesis protein Nop16 [Protomyces lactucae-debilis]ORY76376.1 ribosome biogenesis protein Nop16 [Protomyces lactucae-debilis]
MANPRQRHKQRSSRKTNTRRTADKLKKVNIQSNAIISQHWDKTKTLRQNYAKLGLVTNPNVNPAAGGTEKLYPVAKKEEPMDANGLKKGEALIQRDAQGNVTGIVYGDPQEEAVIHMTAQEREDEHERQKVIAALEQRAHEQKEQVRVSSDGERAWLAKIQQKYGDDYEKAARDRRVNPMQQTAVEIRKRAARLTVKRG